MCIYIYIYIVNTSQINKHIPTHKIGPDVWELQEKRNPSIGPTVRSCVAPRHLCARVGPSWSMHYGSLCVLGERRFCLNPACETYEETALEKARERRPAREGETASKKDEGERGPKGARPREGKPRKGEGARKEGCAGGRTASGARSKPGPRGGAVVRGSQA